MSRVKIVLDADVIIHFSKGDLLSSLPQIFPDYDFIVLETVYTEIKGVIRNQLDRQIKFLNNISMLKFAPTGEMLREYARLSSRMGKGESACMAYCRFNNDVIGSSNLKDISHYCQTHQITHLTTFDFLYFACEKGIITMEEAKVFRNAVVENGSKLPSEKELESYVSRAMM